MPKKFGKIKSISFLLIIFLFLFILIEICLCLFSGFIIKHSLIKPVPFIIKFHQQMDWTYRPKLNLSLKYRDVPLHSFNTDELGFRNLSLHQNPDVLVIGDSFAISEGVGQKQTWSYLLEQRSGKKINNLGIIGSGPVQEIKVLKFALNRWRPDYVFWCFSQNDIYNAEHAQQFRPNAFSRLLFNHSLSASVFLTTYLFLANGGDIYKGLEPAFTFTVGNSQMTIHPFWEHYQYYYELAQIRSMAGYAKTLDILGQARQLADKAGSKLVVVFIPAKEQAHDIQEYLKDEMQSNPELKRVFKNINNIPLLLKQYCRKNKIEFFSLIDGLKKYTAQQEPIYYSVDGHLNEKGNSYIAGLLLEYLTKLSFSPVLTPSLPARSETEP